jgi:hypothetical protein
MNAEILNQNNSKHYVAGHLHVLIAIPLLSNNYEDDDDNDNDNDNEEEDDDNDRDMGNDDNAHGNANKGGRRLLQAVYLEVIIVGKYFNFRIVSVYKLIYHN